MSYADCDYCPISRVKNKAATATAVTINSSAPVSDIAIQRDYFRGRLASAQNDKQSELIKLFNLFVNNTPKGPKALIEAIEKKKYKLDDKKIKRMEEEIEEGINSWDYLPAYYYIIWDGPEVDRKGYDLATIELSNLYNSAKDTIMAGEPLDMKNAIQSVVDWLPKAKKH